MIIQMIINLKKVKKLKLNLFQIIKNKKAVKNLKIDLLSEFFTIIIFFIDIFNNM